jgi:Yip1 domain
MIDRMIRAARLDPQAYEEVEADENATLQAAIVVVLAAVAAGIGALEGGVAGILFGIVAGLIGWIAYATAAYFVGTKLFATEETSASVGELLRTLGFAQTPRLLLVLTFIPVVGLLIGLAVFIWIIFTTVVAIRQALDFDTLRAVGTAIVSVLVLFVVSLLFFLLFGT